MAATTAWWLPAYPYVEQHKCITPCKRVWDAAAGAVQRPSSAAWTKQLLVNQEAHDRQDVASLLGVHRNTVGRWLTAYASGGLDTLLEIRSAPGKPLSLSPEVLASLEQALHQPSGFASYEALRQWLRQTHQVELKYKTLYTIVRTRFKAKLKVPRPSHTKKP